MWAFAIGWLTVLGRNTSLESIQQFPVLHDTCKTNNCKILQAEKIFHDIFVCTSYHLALTDELVHLIT